MKKSVAKILACLLTVTVIVMGLTVSAFAGATTGTYKGQIPIGVYNVYCTLTIDSSSATATAELPEFGFVTLGVSIKGQYRSSKKTIVTNNIYMMEEHGQMYRLLILQMAEAIVAVRFCRNTIIT